MSILWWIFTIIYCIVWLDNDALNSACGLRLRHWKAQRRKSAEDKEGISLARLLWWRPGTTDNAGRDLSSQRMTELNKMFAQTLPHPSTRYIACYGVAFAPAVAAAHKGGTPRFFGLHLPCRCLLSQLPFALFLLPLGMIQSLAGFLSRLLLTFVQWVEPKGIGSIRKSNVVSQTQTAAPKEECEIQLFTSTSKATHKQGAARPPSDDSISDASTGSLSSGEEECGAERHGAEGSVSVVGGVQGGRRGAKEMSSLGVRSRMPELELGNLFEECAQNDASAQVSVKHPAHYDNTQEETIPEKWQPKRADWRIHHAPELEPTVAVGGWGGLGLGFVAYGKSCLSEVVCVVVGAVGKLGGGGEVGNPSEAKARRWNDSEANDGVLSVAAQKAPASECKGAAPREFDSVASLRAAYGAEGSGAAPLGVWTQVLMGFHDHIKITRDGAWQRDFLHDLCLCIILLEGETAPVDANR